MNIATEIGAHNPLAFGCRKNSPDGLLDLPLSARHGEAAPLVDPERKLQARAEGLIGYMFRSGHGFPVNRQFSVIIAPFTSIVAPAVSFICASDAISICADFSVSLVWLSKTISPLTESIVIVFEPDLS